MTTKKVKIKVKKKKLKVKNILIAFLIIALFSLFVAYILNLPVKNIYINGNNLVSDKEIIKLAELSDYPSFIKTYFMNIETNVKKV